MTPQPHEIVIKVGRRNTRRQFYDVWFRGEHLLEHWDPEFAACRALLKRGATGPLRAGGFVLDIEKHARKRTFEPDAGRLRIGKYAEFTNREQAA